MPLLHHCELSIAIHIQRLQAYKAMNFLLLIVHAILLITVELSPAVDGLAIRKKRNMYPEKRWPKDEETGLVNIPWKMNCDQSDENCLKAKAAVEKATETLNKHTCIRFQYRPSVKEPTNYIGVIANDRCAYIHSISLDGTGQKHILSLEEGCAKLTTAIHELIHSLGFKHEFNRPDRDDYITIIRENMDPMSDDIFEKRYGKAVNSETLGMPYDYYSVMHYGGGGGSIITKDPSKQDVLGSGIINGPSQLDYDKINKLYECEKSSFKESKTPDQVLSTLAPDARQDARGDKLLECLNSCVDNCTNVYGTGELHGEGPYGKGEVECANNCLDSYHSNRICENSLSED